MYASRWNRWGPRHRVVAKRTLVGKERRGSEREAQGRGGAARAPWPRIHARVSPRCARTRCTYVVATRACARTRARAAA